MCGIYGIAGALGFRDDKTMQRLLLHGIFRGIDATGLAAVRGNGDVLHDKINSHPLDLFVRPAFKKALNGNESQLYIGHNRLATRGENTSANAHPFEFDTLIGVHNGTLESRCKYRLEKELGIKHPVDSYILYAAIDKFGVKDAMSLVEKGSSQDAGAWSLVWYDKTDHTLNMLRNEWRPMWYGYEDTFKRMFFGSRWQDLQSAYELSEIGYDPLYLQPAKDADGKDVYWKWFTTLPDVHYKWELQGLKEGSKERPKPKATEIKYHEPFVRPARPVDQSGVVVNGPFGHRPIPASMTVNSTTHSTTTGRKKDKQITVINLIGDGTNPFAGIITNDALISMASKGCSWCREALNLNRPGHYVQVRTGTILCPSCAGVKNNSEQANRVYINERQFVEVAKNCK